MSTALPQADDVQLALRIKQAVEAGDPVSVNLLGELAASLLAQVCLRRWACAASQPLTEHGPRLLVLGRVKRLNRLVCASAGYCCARTTLAVRNGRGTRCNEHACC